MDGMSTQELLKGQDLSSANVDDLLAALRQEEGRPVESPVDEIIRHEHSNTKAESGPITDLPDLDAILAASHEAEKVEMEQAAAAVETPAENLDTILNAEIDALSGNPTPAEEAMAEMAPEVDMALTEVAPEMPVVEAMPEAAPEAVAEEPMNMDALMNAMVGEAPAAEAAPEMPVAAEAIPETMPEMPVAEAAPEIPVEAMPEVAAMPEAAPEAVAEEPMNMDALMNAMVGEAQAAEAAPEMPVEAMPEAAPEAVAEEPMNMDALMNAMVGEAPAAEEAPEMPVDAMPEIPVEGMPEVAAMPETAPEAVAEEPMNMDALMNAMVGEAPAAEAAPEMPVAEAMSEVAAMPEAAPEAVAEEPMNMDALMNAMVGEAPAAEAAPEMPVAEAAPEIPAEAIPETAMDMALTEPVEIPEEAPMFEPSMEAVALAEGASLEINEMNDMEESITNVENMTEETNEVVGETQQMSEESAKELLSQFEETAEDLAQTPAELDMDKAADALGGAVEDIENFLETESYEYTTITEDQKTFLILKADDGTAMAIIYDSDEFDSVNLNFDKNGKTVYKEIMNTYIKEIIRTGGSIGINRHRGTKVVTR